VLENETASSVSLLRGAEVGKSSHRQHLGKIVEGFAPRKCSRLHEGQAYKESRDDRKNRGGGENLSESRKR
jgi:hypothetical protein